MLKLSLGLGIPERAQDGSVLNLLKAIAINYNGNETLITFNYLGEETYIETNS